ncbi:DUF4230 domain-containing protein [Micromonosporaceae bacterium DT55]|uniref:DUF4230 domain-containing protein n=1 Tax=Melissospora conviva TaxID=3388432 RepID=UPI003C158723
MSQNDDVTQPGDSPAAGGDADPGSTRAGSTDAGSIDGGRAADPGSTVAGGTDAAGADVASAEAGSSGVRGYLVVAGLLAIALLAVVGLRQADLWPSWRNPFAQQETDRSQPVLLESIQDLSRYVAAEGNFQVVIDLQSDREYVPEFLLNERTLFVGAGSVEAYVDFAQIAEGAIVESADGRTVEIRLPAPQLGEANLDMEKSYVFAEKRGLLNRLGDVFDNDPNRQQRVYQLAEERITAAARETGLTLRAEENTRKMLEGLLRSLGYEQITITYAAP